MTDPTRKVNAARQDDEQHADGHDAGCRGNLPQYVEEVAASEKTVRPPGRYGDEHEKDRQGPETLNDGVIVDKTLLFLRHHCVCCVGHTWLPWLLALAPPIIDRPSRFSSE